MRVCSGWFELMVSIADYLRDFGAPDEVRGVHATRLRPVEPQPVSIDIAPAVPDRDFEAELTAAFARGEQAATARAEAELAAALEAERARHREEMDSVRTSYEQDYATMIASKLDGIAGNLSDTIGEQVGDVLAPFLDSIIRRRVVDELARAIQAAIANGPEASVSVSGPKGLQEQLARHFDDAGVAFAFEESDDMDIIVNFDGTVFATRLADWSEALKEAVA